MHRVEGWTDIDKQTSIGDLLWPRPQLSWEEIGSEEMLPRASARLVFDDAFNGGSSVTISLNGEGNAEASGFRCFWIPIQTVSLSPGERYEVQLAYKLRCEGGEVEPALYVRCGSDAAGFDIQPQPRIVPKHSWEFLTITCQVSESGRADNACCVGLVIGSIFENPSAAYNIAIQLGQLTIVHKPSLDEVTPFKPRLLWADCAADPSDTSQLKLTWEPSISYTVPPLLRESDLYPEVPRPPWVLDRSETWFPRVLYANVYAQARKADVAASSRPSEDAVFLGTSGWGSGSWFGCGPNGFEVKRQEMPESLRQGAVRFYVQPMTDRGEVLAWDQCAFVDYDW